MHGRKAQVGNGTQPQAAHPSGGGGGGWWGAGGGWFSTTVCTPGGAWGERAPLICAQGRSGCGPASAGLGFPALLPSSLGPLCLSALLVSLTPHPQPPALPSPDREGPQLPGLQGQGPGSTAVCPSNSTQSSAAAQESQWLQWSEAWGSAPLSPQVAWLKQSP